MPKLTNSKKDGKKLPDPPVIIYDHEVGREYERKKDVSKAFLGEVSG